MKTVQNLFLLLAMAYCPPKGYFVADENPEAFEAYEATFPYREKLRLPGQLGYEE